MRKILFYIFVINFFFTSCSKGADTLRVPNVHLPNQTLSKDLLKSYVLFYCWQYPEGRHSQNNPSDREVVVVVSAGNGVSKQLIREPHNLAENTRDFYIYKSGCIELGNSIRYIGNALSWRPNYDALTFTSGSDQYLTDFDYYEPADGVQAIRKDFLITRKEYGGLFGEPRGIYWSPDGQRFATLGIDVGLESSGANIWVYDAKSASIVRVTKFTAVGDHVANASWARNGELLAVGYGQAGGIGIAKFDDFNIRNFSYKEITSNTNPKIKKWPYTYKNVIDLMLHRRNILYNSYLRSISQPVWINNDQQLIFTAADDKEASTLFTVNSDGSGLEKLLPQLAGNTYLPKLSPNGQVLAFVRYPNWKDRTRAEIGTVNLLTKEVNSLIVMPAPKDGSDLLISGMEWSPDGKYLAFSSNFQTESDIYVISANGDKWLNLTEEDHGNAVSPVWKP